MPNHCENDLYIQGSQADVAAVLAFIGADKTPPEFDFNVILPYPEPFKAMDAESVGWESFPLPNDPQYEVKLEAHKQRVAVYEAKWGTRKDGYNSGGYDWCCANWGTKWGAYDVARRDYRGDVILTFRTAWSPPADAIIQALAVRFPTCSFVLEYFERGMSFCGGAEWPNEYNYYGERPWEPGIMVGEWYSKGYGGQRGG